MEANVASSMFYDEGMMTSAVSDDSCVFKAAFEVFYSYHHRAQQCFTIMANTH